METTFEIYTLSGTHLIIDRGIISAIMNFAHKNPDETIIGVIEKQWFHKGAIQKPDLE